MSTHGNVSISIQVCLCKGIARFLEFCDLWLILFCQRILSLFVLTRYSIIPPPPLSLSLSLSLSPRLQLFQRFEKFRIIVLGGDGSIGWVLSTVDKYNLHSKVRKEEGKGVL